MNDSGDATIVRLAQLFREHPAWIRAAQRLDARATSNVFFGHRPGQGWRLEHREGETQLLPGAGSHPDFAFRFTPESVERLARASGGVGDFAVELFRLVLETDPRLHVDLRIRAPFAKLVRHGYLGLLAAGGPRVVAFGAAHGVRTLAALRRLVEQAGEREPADWELDAPGRRGRSGLSSTPPGEGTP
jgi:hypothetical protein